jgi:hypothetical protein
MQKPPQYMFEVFRFTASFGELTSIKKSIRHFKHLSE